MAAAVAAVAAMSYYFPESVGGEKPSGAYPSPQLDPALQRAAGLAYPPVTRMPMPAASQSLYTAGMSAYPPSTVPYPGAPAGYPTAGVYQPYQMAAPAAMMSANPYMVGSYGQMPAGYAAHAALGYPAASYAYAQYPQQAYSPAYTQAAGALAPRPSYAPVPAAAAPSQPMPARYPANMPYSLHLPPQWTASRSAPHARPCATQNRGRQRPTRFFATPWGVGGSPFAGLWPVIVSKQACQAFCTAPTPERNEHRSLTVACDMFAVDSVSCAQLALLYLPSELLTLSLLCSLLTQSAKYSLIQWYSVYLYVYCWLSRPSTRYAQFTDRLTVDSLCRSVPLNLNTSVHQITALDGWWLAHVDSVLDVGKLRCICCIQFGLLCTLTRIADLIVGFPTIVCLKFVSMQVVGLHVCVYIDGPWLAMW